MQLSHALAYAIRGCASDVHRTSPTFIRCLLASYWQQLASGRFCRSNMQILNIPKWSWPHLTPVRVAPTQPDLHTIMPINRVTCYLYILRIQLTYHLQLHLSVFRFMKLNLRSEPVPQTCAIYGRCLNCERHSCPNHSIYPIKRLHNSKS